MIADEMQVTLLRRVWDERIALHAVRKSWTQTQRERYLTLCEIWDNGSNRARDVIRAEWGIGERYRQKPTQPPLMVA